MKRGLRDRKPDPDEDLGKGRRSVVAERGTRPGGVVQSDDAAPARSILSTSFFIRTLLFCLGIQVCQAMAADRIPPELTGIWESENAVFNDKDTLFEGQAIYLREDGRGMMIGGPPPIGFMFEAEYDPGRNILQIKFQPEDQPSCQDGEISHDPKTATLDADVEFKRRRDRLPSHWGKYMDRSPIKCPIEQR